jgi:DNA-binding response OmpR family regulator
MKKYRIVVVDDHYDILELLKHNLINEGYEVKIFYNAVDALKYVNMDNTDLVLSDWMMPEMDGLEFCKNLKMRPSTQNIPLEVGAEDYITKPVRIKEMLSRIKKILRRKLPDDIINPRKELREFIECGVLKMDLVSYRVFISDAPLELTIGEFKLLEMLARQPGKVFSRNQIIERINGSQYFATERSIDVQIAGLRKKMGEYKDAIETIRSVGYRFKVPIP